MSILLNRLFWGTPTQVFENIDFHYNGNIKTYRFIDEDNESYFFRVDYDSSGVPVKCVGEPFFQAYLTEIDPNKLEVKRGQTMEFRMFYPNPPVGKANLFVKIDDVKHSVFKQDDNLGFLKYVKIDNDVVGQYVVDIWLEIDLNGSIMSYNNPLFYKVVD